MAFLQSLQLLQILNPLLLLFVQVQVQPFRIPQSFNQRLSLQFCKMILIHHCLRSLYIKLRRCGRFPCSDLILILKLLQEFLRRIEKKTLPRQPHLILINILTSIQESISSAVLPVLNKRMQFW